MPITWTLSEIMSNATAALGNRTDITPSLASFWANQAQAVVWDVQPHREKEALAVSSTTSGENRISLPTDFDELLNLSSSSGSLDILQIMNRDEIDSASTSTGRPTHFIHYQDHIQLWPTPESAYSIQLRYHKKLSTMVETTDQLSVGTRYGLPTLYKTTQLLADAKRDFETAALYEDKFVRFVLETPSDKALRQREQHYMGVSLPRKQL